MSMNCHSPELQSSLEALIDMAGLTAVLEALQIVIDEKADHIVASYSDGQLARTWQRAGVKLNPAISESLNLPR